MRSLRASLVVYLSFLPLSVQSSNLHANGCEDAWEDALLSECADYLRAKCRLDLPAFWPVDF